MNYDPFIKEDFVLPEKWCIKSQSRDQDYLINEFARSSGGMHWSNEYNHAKSNYLNISNGKYQRGSLTLDKNFTEITFEQFKKYVLKEPIEQSKSIEKWSVGSYVVAIKNSTARSKPEDSFKVGFINKIDSVFNDSTIGIEFSSNCCDKSDFQWFATKSEAEEFAKTLVKPVNRGNGILDAVDVKQPLKQAVHCKTQEEWDFVSEKIGYKFLTNFKLGRNDTINTAQQTCECKAFYERRGEYQLLSFQEWCQQCGYKMEKEVKFEVGDYIILENAGGWSCSPCNNGCLGVIKEICNYKPTIVDKYICSITGDILNSKNEDKTFKDIPIAFYRGKWIVRHATLEEINNHLISIGQIPAEPICTNTNSSKHDGCGEKYGCIQNCDECDYYQIPAGEPLNTGIEPNKDGMFKYKQTVPGASWSGGTIQNHLDVMIPTTGNIYSKNFSTSVIPVKPISTEVEFNYLPEPK